MKVFLVIYYFTYPYTAHGRYGARFVTASNIYEAQGIGLSALKKDFPGAGTISTEVTELKHEYLRELVDLTKPQSE